ncbi:gliding motility lipoprotein GldB [Dysgonomonas macrotermitis]|uniref:Gliding motility-associated lipoprotein GldB n=1 Tax=Dysgonomonas macrotermitis TaxID=1346286 RepID=A0A1M5AK62_9BACT|nr:hypothetical protein [Dysgonomonas macrotermitis]SHF30651.1 hypothetical protein SAMN05444362_10581 [Dysgonomonas macrotermitis]
MKYVASFIFFFVSVSSFCSCTGHTEKTNNSAYVQDQGSLITVERFDIDFHSYLIDPTTEKEISLKEKYPQFLKAFGTVTVDNKDVDVDSPECFARLREYFSNKILSKIYTDALSQFADMTIYQQQLTEAASRANTLLKGKQLPTFGVHVSGFKANTIVLDNYISISTDKYLGKDYPAYQEFFEEYQRIQMQPEYIVRDYLKAWLLTEQPKSNKRKDLVSEMLYEGKILYALQQLLPDWSEADILGYTADQIKWCDDNSKNIWKKTVDQNNLFSTDFLTIQKYMDEAPYTASISADSPGRIGAWLGLQIIKNYAKNTGDDLSSILALDNNQNILNKAKYNP